MTRLPAATPVHRVRLQFGAGGPAVTGGWIDGVTAGRAWHAWVGLYGSDQMVAIRLAREAGGAENVLMAWENRHPVEQGDSGSRVMPSAQPPQVRVTLPDGQDLRGRLHAWG